MALSQKAQNPDLALATIVKVDLSADQSIVKIHIDIDGNDAQKARALKVLEIAVPFLRSEIAATVRMRRIPAFKFIIDKGRENAERVEELLKQIKKEGG